MGLVDVPTAHRFNLPTAKLVNASGKAVAPTTASITAGFHGMVAGADGTLVANPASTDPTAYPLVKVDYLMVPKQTDAAHKAHIQDLLVWGATEGQKTLPDGYLPLPDTLVAQTEKVASEIAVPTPVVVRHTTTTTVKTGSTTVPTTVFQPSSDESCCSASPGDTSVGSGDVPVTTPGATGSTPPATTKKMGAVGPVATSTATPTATSAAAADKPAATIANAGATLALPALFGTALLAGLIAATRRAWPRLLKSRRFAKILPAKFRRAPSGTA
jgi:hypothetical protein